jgi:hypothetical protein
MTTTPSPSHQRTLFLAELALVALGLFLTSRPAEAAPGGVYAAVLITPLAVPRREIIDGAVWRCDRDRCTAPADGARPQSLCSKVARKFGPVSRFATPKGELTDEQLMRCNAAI